MADSNILDTTTSTSGRDSGLNSLFTLANLAVMTEKEQRSAASSSPLMSSPLALTSTTTVSTASTAMLESEESSPPSSETEPSSSCNITSYSPRRPAKKRPMPAEFEVTNTQGQGNGVTTTTTRAAKVATPESPRTCSKPSITTPKATASSSSKPATKRRKQSKSNKQRRRAATFKMKASGPSFPVILMGIMSAPQNKDFITFLSDNNSFIIIHPGVLVKNVLPIHFDDTVPTFDQFLNLLAIWGFEIVKDPQFPQVNVYKHPTFHNGDWEACLKMKLPNLNLNDQKDAVKSVATSQGCNTNSDSHRLPQPSSSPRGDVPIVANESFHPFTSTSARSVTPPDSSTGSTSDATLLGRVASTQTAATQTTQPRQQMQHSNLGLKFPSVKENVLCSCLLKESNIGGNVLLDQILYLQQPGLQQGTPQGHMVGYADSPMVNTTLPPKYRRATVSDMASITSSHLLTGNYAMPQNLGRMSAPFSTCFHNSQLQQQKQQQQQLLQSQMQTINAAKATPYSDAQVQSATEDIVHAAVNVLCQNDNMIHQHQAQKHSPSLRSRRHTVDTVPNSTVCLDAMTDVLLERSLARLMSRPMVMTGPRNNSSSRPVQQAIPSSSMRQHQQSFFGGADASMSVNDLMSRQSLIASVGAEVEAQTKACLASRSQKQCYVNKLGHF